LQIPRFACISIFMNEILKKNTAQNGAEQSVSGIRIPAEWEAQEAVWTIWPSHDDLWPGNIAQARAEVAGMVKGLAKGGKVYVLAMGDDALNTAQTALNGAAEVIAARFGDVWLRDTGPIFARTDSGIKALRFQTNGWGGKYVYEFDDIVGDTVAQRSGYDIIRHSFVLEGGAVEHDGKGTILTTRQCVLNPNRNAGWTQEDAEAALKAAFGAKRILWLDQGLAGDHTDGHIDNIARFVAPNTVVCQSPFGADDPNTDTLNEIKDNLESTGLTVITIPSPGLVTDADGEAVPASHMNFIIGNKSVVVPVYGTKSADMALAKLQDCFPNHEVIGVPSNALLTGGGSFHCITQQEPKA
jgi:agmatine deiminase